MRVIAGKFKGTKLIAFDEENIRPTLDKVREAIFSKIQMEIKYIRVKIHSYIKRFKIL